MNKSKEFVFYIIDDINFADKVIPNCEHQRKLCNFIEKFNVDEKPSFTKHYKFNDMNIISLDEVVEEVKALDEIFFFQSSHYTYTVKYENGVFVSISSIQKSAPASEHLMFFVLNIANKLFEEYKGQK